MALHSIPFAEGSSELLLKRNQGSLPRKALARDLKNQQVAVRREMVKCGSGVIECLTDALNHRAVLPPSFLPSLPRTNHFSPMVQHLINELAQMDRAPITNGLLTKAAVIPNRSHRSHFVRCTNTSQVIRFLAEGTSRVRFLRGLNSPPCFVVLTTPAVMITLVGQSLLLGWILDGAHKKCAADVEPRPMK